MFRSRMNRWIPSAIVLLALGSSAAAQSAAGISAEIKQKVAVLKQSLATNQKKIRQYQWTEIQQLTLNGDTKPEQQFMCQYGPNGQVEKYPMGPQEQPSGGRLKQKIIAKKKQEMTDYLADVKSLLAEYLPPNPQKIQQAVGTHNLAISQDAAAGVINLAFSNYAQPGDQMIIGFNTTSKAIASIKVNTYMGEAKDKVDLSISYSTLPDGTNYPEKTVLNVAAKQIVITTLNTSYRKLGAN